MIELRPRQIDVIDRARQSIASGKRAPIIVAPTGSGKTVCGASIIQGAESKSKSVLFLAHRFELVCQASLKLASFDINHNIVAPAQSIRQIKVEHFKTFGRSFVDHRSGVDVGTVQTKSRRLGSSRNKYDLIMPDECHLSIADSYKKVIAESPRSLLLGLTATPWRLDGKGLGIHCGGLYDDLAIMCQPQDLVDDGLLVPFRIYGGSKPPPDMSDIKLIDSAKGQAEVGERMSKPFILGDTLDHYMRLGIGRPAMGFCASIKQAELNAEKFRGAGIKAVAISGNSSNEERKLVNGLDDGSIEVVFNCALYVEGLDKPCISYIMDLASTNSLTRALQKWGRGSRTFTGKYDCILADHAGNVGREVNGEFVAKHGFPADDREWSLDGAKKKKRKNEEPAVNITRCPVCFAIHRPAPVCPQCGHAYVSGAKRKDIKQVEGTLVEITPEQRKQMQVVRKREEWQCKTLEDFIELGKARGYQYAEAWARKRYAFRAKKTIDNVNR